MSERPAGPGFELAPLLGFLAMVGIWGSTFLVIRIGDESLPPGWGATLRLTLAAILNWAVVLVTRPGPPDRRALPGILLFGALNLGLSMILLYYGERTLPSGIAAVFYGTIPITTGVVAWLLRVQSIAAGQILGSIIGLLGVALIFSGELHRGAPFHALAGVFVGAIAAATAGVFLKRGPAQSPFLVNAIGCTLAALLAATVSAVMGESHALPRSAAAWWPIVYLALLGNLGAFVLYVWLVGRWKVTRVATSALLIPVAAVMLGAVARHEALAPTTYAGAVAVLGGVAWTIASERRAQARGAEPAAAR